MDRIEALIRRIVREELAAVAERIEHLQCHACMGHNEHDHCDTMDQWKVARAIRGEARGME